MKVFAWSNSDVFSWLHQVRNRKLKSKEVSAKILSNYARKVSLKTISRHVPQESLKALTVIPISTEFGGSMKAVKLGKSFFHLCSLHKISNNYLKRYRTKNIALKESEKKGENVTDLSSLAMKFPSYKEVRYQLGRLRRDGVLNVEGPFELPEIYKNTRAKERWELLSDRLNVMALFSPDRSLLVAAQCKYLAVDAALKF